MSTESMVTQADDRAQLLQNFLEYHHARSLRAIEWDAIVAFLEAAPRTAQPDPLAIAMQHIASIGEEPFVVMKTEDGWKTRTLAGHLALTLPEREAVLEEAEKLVAAKRAGMAEASEYRLEEMKRCIDQGGSSWGVGDWDDVRDFVFFASQARVGKGPWAAALTTLGLEWGEDGYSLRTPYDGDVNDDTGQHIVVGGETVVTFSDSDEGDRAREWFHAALTTPAPAVSTDEIAGALRWLRAFWEPGSNHDTEEVKCALANADAILSRIRGDSE